MPSDVLYTGKTAAEPFVAGTVVAEEGERVKVQPSAGGDPVWLPRTSVFLKSPPPSTGAKPPLQRARPLHSTSWCPRRYLQEAADPDPF